jgi:hypothetical protein
MVRGFISRSALRRRQDTASLPEMGCAAAVVCSSSSRRSASACEIEHNHPARLVARLADMSSRVVLAIQKSSSWARPPDATAGEFRNCVAVVGDRSVMYAHLVHCMKSARPRRASRVNVCEERTEPACRLDGCVLQGRTWLAAGDRARTENGSATSVEGSKSTRLLTRQRKLAVTEKSCWQKSAKRSAT